MKLRFLAPALVLAFLVALFASGLTRDPTEIPSPLVGKPAPDFVLPTLDGRTLDLDALRGQPVLVNYWASWCTPCLEEHPLLLQLAHQGVRIVGIAYKDDPEASRAWLARHGNPFAAVALDRDGRTGLDWGVYGVPETYALDPSLTIRAKQVGPLTRAAWDARFAPLLAGPVS